MFIDATTLPPGTAISTDVCIVGGGAAGITLARELAGSHRDVALFEAGGLEPDGRTQALYRGTTSDPAYTPLDESRFRWFGGSTNRWAGWCRALDPIDFEARAAVPESGWPFGADELAPFYDRALTVCRADGARAVGNTETPWPLDSERVVTSEFRLSPPVNFGSEYRDELARASNVTIYLNANATLLLPNMSRTRLDRIVFVTLDGRETTVSARHFVLAAGGIENARLMLASVADSRHAVGNAHDLVGRYYMDHPAFFSGLFVPSAQCPSPALYTTPHVSNPGSYTSLTAGFALPERTLRREGLLNSVVRLVPRPAHTTHHHWERPAVASARRIATSILRGRIPGHARDHARNIAADAPAVLASLARSVLAKFRPESQLVLRSWVESAPSPNNRVTLSHRRNAIGPLAHVDWTTGELEKRSVIRLHEHLAAEVERLGFGRVTPFLRTPAEPWPASQAGASHHMGTTRMHDSPAKGVVDRHCQVHEMENLYVAGSSVFPTSGYANPTLTIVALALRLADRLKSI